MKIDINPHGIAVIHSGTEVARLLGDLSRTPLTPRFVPYRENGDFGVMLEKSFSEIAAGLSGRADFPRVTEGQLFELPFGELMVLIFEFLTKVDERGALPLCTLTDGNVLVRALARILARYEPLEEGEDYEAEEYIAHCTLGGWIDAFRTACPDAVEMFDVLFKNAIELLEISEDDLSEAMWEPLNGIFFRFTGSESGSERVCSRMLMLLLIVRPFVFYEYYACGVTAADVCKKLTAADRS